MKQESRKIYDYPRHGEWIFRLGHVHFLKAHPPMKLHTHPGMMEFVYLERGRQVYRVGEEFYTLRQGEVFFTLPDELHDTGSAPEERSSLYYLIIDPERIKERHLFQREEEYRALTALPERVFRATANLPKALKQLEKSFSDEGPHFDTRIRNALSGVLLDFITPADAPGPSPLYRIQNSLCYIQSHLDQPIRVAELAPLDRLSLAAYNRIFLEAMGIPPGEYILRQRIALAKRLLAETDRSVTEIAYETGFSSSQYFATVFKRFCNCTPKEYRKTV